MKSLVRLVSAALALSFLSSCAICHKCATCSECAADEAKTKSQPATAKPEAKKKS